MSPTPEPKPGSTGRNRRRGSSSIRRSAAFLFAAVIVLSLLLIAGFEMIVSSYYRGETNSVTRLFKPAPPAVRSAGSLLIVMRRFNALLLEGGDRVLDTEALERMAREAAPLGIALRVDQRLSFASPPLSHEQEGRLPAFGASAPLEPFREEPRPDFRSDPGLIFQMDFRTTSGRAASFFILRAPRQTSPKQPFSRQLSLIVMLLIMAGIGAMGVLFILRITGPLRRVESAARAISRGDLDTPIAGGYRFIELERVFEALETMRAEIRQLLDKEREGEASRRELIANLSHDLRTPLSAIRGYVDGLREGIADTAEKRARYLEVAGQKIQDLDRMIGQIFLLSTLSARDTPPELRKIDLREFLMDSVADLRLAHGADTAIFESIGLDAEKGAEVHGLGRGPMVMADPLQLRRVVENLVDNALRHGGLRPIRLRIGLERGGLLSDRRKACFPEVRPDAAVGSAPGLCSIVVEDNGRGIPEENLERVFERFWRGDSSRPSGGFGLGLAIARQIVEAQGGRLIAEPVRPGLRMRIELPEVEA